MRQSASKPSNKLSFYIVIGLVLLITVGYFTYQQLPKAIFAAPAPDSDLVVPDVPIPSTEKVLAHKAKSVTEMSEINRMVAELAERMKRQFSDSIHLVSVQVGLKNLRDDLIRGYAEQGQALFVRILNKAFPEWTEAILNAIALMDEYNAWLQSMLLDLNDMNALEQQGVLWEKRRALFGDAAIQIWQEEISAEQERQMTMRRTMEILDQSYNTQMQERLYLLQSTFEESYADKLQNMVIDPKGVLAQVFFGFDAVQRDLKKMSSEDRQAQINQIRTSMGFSEEQVQKLAEADQKREKRWQNGYAYMEASKAAKASLTGEALNQELDKIREKFFAHEASTIKKEEEELEFYRYERPRIYGHN